MIPLDEIAPNYRRAKDRWATAPTLAAHYHTVAEAYAGTGQALIEAVKSFLECTCRTIVADYGVTLTNDPSTTELLVATLDRLGLRNTRGASKFDRVLSAHNRLADALTECRNEDGAVAHGKDGFLDALAKHHVRLYLLTGDTLLSLVLGALEGTDPDLNHTREPYERFGHFNAAIDSATGVGAEVDLDERLLVLRFSTAALESLELRVEPSRLLYQLDRAAYVEILESIPRSLELQEVDIAAPEPAMTTFSAVIEGGGGAALARRYDGPHRALAADLTEYLQVLKVSASKQNATRIVPSLLATFDQVAGLDWAHRDALRAKVQVAFKRTLRQLDATRPSPEKIAPELVSWFAARVPSVLKE